MIRDPGRTDYRIVALSPGFVEATGLVNDHLVDCFRYAETAQLPRKGRR